MLNSDPEPQKEVCGMHAAYKYYLQIFLCGWCLFVFFCLSGCARLKAPSVSALIHKLNNGDCLAKLEALEDLRKLGSNARAAIPTLINILEHENAPIPGAAAAVTQNVSVREEYANSIIRATAAETLGAIGPDAKPAMPVLVAKLKDKHVCVRGASAKALADIGVREKIVLDALKEALDDPDTSFQLDAAKALVVLDPDSQDAVSALAKLLKDKESDTREAAAYSLGIVKSTKIKSVIPALVITLKDRVEQVRLFAAQSLGSICEESATVVPALIERLNNDKSISVRIQIVQALGEFGPEAQAAIPALTRALKDPNDEVRILAAQSLKQIGVKRKEKTAMLKSGRLLETEAHTGRWAHGFLRSQEIP